MKKEEIIEKLLAGEMKLYQIDKFTESATEALDIRREFIERHSNCQLDKIADYTLDMELAFAKNIENPIGTVQIPIGVAGPLRVNGEYAKDDFFVPLATSEGALLASVNRGCSAITAAGGANARVIGDKMTRAPAIKTESVVEAVKVKQWFENKFEELKEIAESTTSHGKLVKIDPIIIVGNYVYPRFVYSTGDSMGMNMVTIATQEAMNFIENENDIDIRMVFDRSYLSSSNKIVNALALDKILAYEEDAANQANYDRVQEEHRKITRLNNDYDAWFMFLSKSRCRCYLQCQHRR